MDLPAKTEANFAAYLRHAITGDVAIREARQGGPPPSDGALLIVQASAGLNHPDLVPSDGNFLLDLTLTLRIPARRDSDRPAELDSLLEELHCALIDLATVQAGVNAPSSGADTRPAQAFHLYNIEPLAITQETENNQWIETRTYQLTTVAADA